MKAAIDIGTNTVLLLIAENHGDYINVIHEEQRIPRLGKGVDESRLLHQESINRVMEALKEYKQIISDRYSEVEEVIVTATSAVRDAKNREYFLDLVKDELGFEVNLLSGDQEAQCTFLGALSVIDFDTDQPAFVLDIGGGSTEVALGSKKGIENYHSFDMGSVRFKERFLLDDPPSKDSIEKCKKEVERFYASQKFDVAQGTVAVAVAGTATTLAAIDSDMEEYDAARLNGYIISKEILSKHVAAFSTHTYETLLDQNPVFLKGREDIFLAGLLILEEFMSFYNIDQIRVSTGGIRHGVILGGIHNKN